MSTASPIAVAISDIHFSHRPPLFRSKEPDWLEAQARAIYQPIDVCNKHQIPLLIAGDIFDKWTVPSELIHLVIRWFKSVKKGVYAIPGQHDLPNHEYNQRHRSAYGVLEVAEAIHSLAPTARTNIELPASFELYGYPWGFLPDWQEGKSNRVLRIALCHHYIWNYHDNTSKHKEASVNDSTVKMSDAFAAFDMAIFGDNHIPFRTVDGASRTTFVNCGKFITRKSDEVKHPPCFYIIQNDLSATSCSLDTSKDVYLEPDEIIKGLEQAIDISDFIEDMGVAFDDTFDIKQQIADAARLHDISHVRKALLRILEGNNAKPS